MSHDNNMEDGRKPDQSETKWQKILYKDQFVPDNYVDESFLDEVRKNVYTRTYDYWTVVWESGVITQQLSSVCLFVVCFIYMSESVLSPDVVLLTSFLLTLGGYIVNVVFCSHVDESRSKRKVLDDVKTAMMFSGCSVLLSPVLVTLTETISTDTIYAMTTVMIIANLLFHDYGANAAMVSGAISLNAGIFASVCLASRLHTALHALATVTVALQVFGLWPDLRRNLKATSRSTHPIMTVVLGLLAIGTLLSISVVAAILFTACHIFVTFVCPAWLMSLQPYKNNIHGPWDEAVIEE
ncbi:hypothetical protein ScPMuIL_004485 [Solemya velum]